jgi:hypothetical protein
MKRSIGALGLLFLGTVGGAWANPPFSPLADVPDHVVTMARRSGGNETRYTVLRHGAWTRIGPIENVGERGRASTVTYVDHAQALSLRIARNGITPSNPTPPYAFLVLLRGVEAHRGSWFATGTRTGERDTLLGESCEVFVLAEHARSCVTPDGIELWRRYRNSPEYVATALERRPVAPDEVRPPAGLLQPASVLPGQLDFSSLEPGADIVLEPADAHSRVGQSHQRIVRRTVSSAYTEDRLASGYRRVQIQIGGRAISVEQNADGTLRALRISGRAPTPSDPTDRREAVLEEECRWFDLLPGARHVYRTECRTFDGFPLRMQEGGRFRRGDLIATRFHRREMTPAEMFPVERFFQAGLWGLPE